jgi:photosystem II stability/assembly factor-like uncharacterized protein
MKITILRFFLLSSLIALFFSCSKSSNGPSTAPKFDSLYNWSSIGGIAVTNGINDIWFTSLSKGFAAASDGNLYQTQDSGKNWTVIPNTTSAPPAGMANLFFADAQYGFAQGAAQLQVTRDGGSTWTLRSLPTTRVSNVFFSSRAIGYYGDLDSGVYKTTDTGQTWTRTFRSTQANIDYPMWFLNPGKGFILSGDGVFSKTMDSATTWQQVKTGVFSFNAANPTFNTLQFVDSLTGYYASSQGVLKTSDGGHTWSSVYPGTSGYLNVIKFVSATIGYYKSDYAVYKTTDGGQTWTTSCKLVNGDVIIGMFFFDSTTGWICTAKGYVLRINNQ